MRSSFAPRAALAALLVIALAGGVASAKPKGRRGSRGAAPPTLSQAERDISTAMEHLLLPNGGMIWSVQRDGTHGTAALLVRGGARQEELEQNGVALAAARWVELSVKPDDLAKLQVTLDLEMLHGGALFTLRGPQASLPTAMARLLKAATRPDPSLAAHARDRASLESRRFDQRARLPELIGAAAWTGSSFELPIYGNAEIINGLTEEQHRAFHQAAYRPRNMTVLAFTSKGASAFKAALASAGREKMARGALSPGSPGLPVHQVLRGGAPVTVAGVALPGPDAPGAALLLRGRAEELIEEAIGRGQLTGPVVVDVVWTRSASVVFAAILHPPSEPPEEKEQAAQLKILEDALSDAANVPDGELTELRKREGARLTRAFASPEGALRLLAPLAAVVEEPVDVRKAVLATPTDTIRAGLAQAARETSRLSIRRLKKASP